MKTCYYRVTCSWPDGRWQWLRFAADSCPDALERAKLMNWEQPMSDAEQIRCVRVK